mmetsp:Transcript_19229/g.23397  ORF Transcript_19229/g.23397 Transcript_19229/m.23397 type:complete len:209 (-) Transcript_19229:590-1216(-)
MTTVPASYLASKTCMSCSFSSSSSSLSSSEDSESSSELSSPFLRFFDFVFLFFLALSLANCFFKFFCSSRFASFFSASSMTGRLAVSIAYNNSDILFLHIFGILVPSLSAQRLYRSSTSCLKLLISLYSPQLVPPFRSIVWARAHISAMIQFMTVSICSPASKLLQFRAFSTFRTSIPWSSPISNSELSFMYFKKPFGSFSNNCRAAS